MGRQKRTPVTWAFGDRDKEFDDISSAHPGVIIKVSKCPHDPHAGSSRAVLSFDYQDLGLKGILEATCRRLYLKAPTSVTCVLHPAGDCSLVLGKNDLLTGGDPEPIKFATEETYHTHIVTRDGLLPLPVLPPREKTWHPGGVKLVPKPPQQTVRPSKPPRRPREQSPQPAPRQRRRSGRTCNVYEDPTTPRAQEYDRILDEQETSTLTEFTSTARTTVRRSHAAESPLEDSSPSIETPNGQLDDEYEDFDETPPQDQSTPARTQPTSSSTLRVEDQDDIFVDTPLAEQDMSQLPEFESTPPVKKQPRWRKSLEVLESPRSDETIINKNGAALEASGADQPARPSPTANTNGLSYKATRVSSAGSVSQTRTLAKVSTKNQTSESGKRRREDLESAGEQVDNANVEEVDNSTYVRIGVMPNLQDPGKDGDTIIMDYIAIAAREEDKTMYLAVPTWSINGLHIGDYTIAKKLAENPFEMKSRKNKIEPDTLFKGAFANPAADHSAESILKWAKSFEGKKLRPHDPPVKPKYSSYDFKPCHRPAREEEGEKTDIKVVIEFLNKGAAFDEKWPNGLEGLPLNIQADITMNETFEDFKNYIHNDVIVFDRPSPMNLKAALSTHDGIRFNFWSEVQIWVMPQSSDDGTMYRWTKESGFKAREFLDRGHWKETQELYFEVHIVPPPPKKHEAGEFQEDAFEVERQTPVKKSTKQPQKKKPHQVGDVEEQDEFEADVTPVKKTTKTPKKKKARQQSSE